MTDSTGRLDAVHVYPDSAGQWRWRRVAVNGRIVASSGEAFATRGNAVRAARRANAGVLVEIARRA